MFPNRNPQMMDLLNRILKFNPFFRPSAFEAIQNPIFDKIRDQNNLIKSSQKIEIEIDQTDFNLTKAQLKETIKKEVFVIKSIRKQ